MKKILVFLMILWCWNVGNPIVTHAESSLEEEMQMMRVQFQDMQQRLGNLESKVESQAQQIRDQETAKQAYEQKIRDLEDQLAKHQSQTAPVSSNRTQGAKWTPEIGVVADTVFKLDSPKVDAEGADRLSLRELELVFGSNVDPYSRLDATIAFSDLEEPSLEEAYLTRFALPLDVTARIGKFKPKVGKALAVHRDSLDTVDEPLVIQKYFGAEGMNKSGVDFSKTLDLPFPVTQQVSFGILEGGNGEEGTAFGATKRRPTLYSHLKNYVDVTDSTGIELSFSHMIGSRDQDSRFEVQILGSDVSLTQHFNANQNMKISGEVFNLTRKETVNFDGNLWGGYGLIDFRLHPLWSLGFRYDYVQPVDNDRSLNPQKEDRGYTGYLTFYQSEFARWRAQFSHVDMITGKDDNTVMIQGTFAIGDHKHKLQ